MKSPRIGNVPARVVPGIAGLLILILPAASAQAPSPQTAPPTTTIRVSTRLVTIDVVAQDKKGQPIPGLTKNDFELWEDGIPQEIREFSIEGSMVLPAPGRAPLATVPAGTLTNRPAQPLEIPTASTVILLDGLNTRVDALAMARNQIAKFLRHMEPGDRVALYSRGKDLWIVQDFTSDSTVLLKALEGMHAERNAPAGPQLSSLFPPDVSLAKLTPLMWPQIVGMTLRGFEAIGQHLTDVPGRKTLIWISYGIPLTVKDAQGNETDFTPQVRKASCLLSNYNVALYPIDARGLVVGEYGPGSQPTALSMSGPVKAMLSARDTSILLAELTGGRAVYGDNDFALAIRSAIDDARLTYVLGYYPAAEKWDSQFHTFKVRVNRPGVKLLYRTGYLAIDPQNRPADERQRTIERALQSPLDSTAIGFRAQLQKSGAGGAPQLTLNLTVDITDLQMKQDHHQWTGGVEIVIAQRGPDGNIVSGSARKHSVTLNLKEDLYTQLQKQGLSLSFPVTLDPHSVQLKVLVRDTNSGAIGSVGIPLNKTAGE